MSWNPALPAYTSKIAISPGYFQGNNSAIQSVLSSANLTTLLPYIPVTAPVWFYINVAPAGWTATGVGGDTLLAISGGTSQYNFPGGTQNGTWLGPAASIAGGAIGGIGIGSFTSHTHDWVTTRPTASIGILCTKNP